MTLGVDAYLSWAPADMASGADWLGVKSDLVEEAARDIREAGERGTEGQCGQFITRRREESEEISGRVFQLADMLHGASKVLRAAAAELDVLVAGLREVENELLEMGFVRVEGEHVRDTRTTYADATERSDRETEAERFRTRIWELLGAIRETDDRANRELHGIVGREVRDRTAAGNGAPGVVLPALFKGEWNAAVPSAAASTAAALAGPAYGEALAHSWRRPPVGFLAPLRGMGPVATILGFVGGVAAAPEDEPLHETLLAEGAGVLGGELGGRVGFGFGGFVGGPVLAGAGHFSGGLVGGLWAASQVRERFDRAN